VTGSSSVDPFLSIQITLSDPSGTAFSNTLLPLTPPNVSAFVQPPFSFALFDTVAGNQIEAEGVLDSLQCTAGCSSNPAPEPNVLALLSVALGALAFSRRREFFGSAGRSVKRA
jgi:hypothetical protein